MAKKIDIESIKLRAEAETTLRDSLRYLTKYYGLNPSILYGPVWAPSIKEKEKLLFFILERRFHSYLEHAHSILKSIQ